MAVDEAARVGDLPDVLRRVRRDAGDGERKDLRARASPAGRRAVDIVVGQPFEELVRPGPRRLPVPQQGGGVDWSNARTSSVVARIPVPVSGLRPNRSHHCSASTPAPRRAGSRSWSRGHGRGATQAILWGCSRGPRAACGAVRCSARRGPDRDRSDAIEGCLRDASWRHGFSGADSGDVLRARAGRLWAAWTAVKGARLLSPSQSPPLLNPPRRAG